MLGIVGGDHHSKSEKKNVEKKKYTLKPPPGTALQPRRYLHQP
jgi:hypothetical protein